jgi:hypothetical protein
MDLEGIIPFLKESLPKEKSSSFMYSSLDVLNIDMWCLVPWVLLVLKKQDRRSPYTHGAYI